jgi:hypothetical protein
MSETPVRASTGWPAVAGHDKLRCRRHKDSPMSQTAIFAPMGVLAFWTFAVLLVIPFRRFRAGFAGQITADDFKFGESSNVPGHVTIPNRAMMNLLELPVLFYVVTFGFYVTQHAGPGVIWLSWVYVTLRIVHSIIHLTSNRIIPRLTVFAASNVVLLTMWLRFLLRVI